MQMWAEHKASPLIANKKKSIMELLVKYDFGKRTHIRTTEKIFDDNEKYIAEVYNADRHDFLEFRAGSRTHLFNQLKQVSGFCKRKHISIRTYDELSENPTKLKHFARYKGFRFRANTPQSLIADIKQFENFILKTTRKLKKAGYAKIIIKVTEERTLQDEPKYSIKTEGFTLDGTAEKLLATIENFLEAKKKLPYTFGQLYPVSESAVLLKIGGKELVMNSKTERQKLKLLRSQGIYQYTLF